MKKVFVKISCLLSLLFMLGAASCSFSSGGGGDSGSEPNDTEQKEITDKNDSENGQNSTDEGKEKEKEPDSKAVPKITSVKISGVSEKIESDGKLELTANPVLEGEIEVFYTWTIEGEGASLSATEGKTVTLEANNDSTDDAKSVKITVTAKDSNGVLASDAATVVIEKKNVVVLDEVTEISVSGESCISYDEKTVLTANIAKTGNPSYEIEWNVSGDADAVKVEYSEDKTQVTVTAVKEFSQTKTVKFVVSAGGVTSEEFSLEIAAAEKGTVAISVTVDGKYHCGVCDAAYDTKEEAEKCGKTEECPKYEYTVTFTNTDSGADEENKTKTVKVVKGETLAEDDVPAWTNSDSANAYDLEWLANTDGYTTSSKIKSNVTFTTNWKKYFTVTFMDSVAGEGDAAFDDVPEKVYENDKVSAPDWAKEGYTLSWEPEFNADAEVKASAIYTAKWTGRTSYTVTYKDEEGGSNADVTESVYSGDKPAKVPAWTKEHYTLSWKIEDDVVSPADSIITGDTAFTAVWTEDRYYTVKFVDVAVSADVTGGEEIAAEADDKLDTQKVYDGEKPTLPAWASDTRTNKASYTVTWTSSVSGLTPVSAITAAEGVTEVTFTASWSKTPALSYITFTGTKSAGAACSTPAYDVTVSGNIKSDLKIKYDDVEYEIPLKMESKTAITISGAAGKTVKIVADASGKAFNIVANGKTTATGTTAADGTAYSLSFTAPEGESFTIGKKDTCNVGVIIIEN